MPAFLLVQARAELAVGDARAACKTLDDTLLISRLEREPWLQAHAARLRFEVERALGNSAAATSAQVDCNRLALAHGALLFTSK